MRVDKFLWCIRLFKTRSMATEACNKGQVKINNMVVKPAKEISPTDLLSVRKDQIYRRYKINDIPASRLSASLVGLYVIDTTPSEDVEKMKLIRQTASYYRNLGTGRPTKKDRRSLDDFNEDLIDNDESES
ncbi:MAG: RNA-binding protein [Flavobacteriales bacterium CG_4_9_14_3_um_filter_40_17]|nr:MAG: RNA-binding protein [Flavobacteriales bacterium CG_4_9_14_3_um_filter_40_17]